MKAVFMGTPEFACRGLAALANSRHELLAVVSAPDKPSGRGRKLNPPAVKLAAIELGLPVLQPEKLGDETFIQALSDFQADLFVIIAFRILPRSVFTLPSRGSINIHASLLPRYRGAAPITHALLNGEESTGLTSFFLTARVDTGMIIDQVTTIIGPDENYTSLAGRLAEMSGPFLLQTLERIEQPGFAPVQQTDEAATPAPKISPDDGLIDWTLSPDRVHNQVRAFSEEPGAFCLLQGKKLKILATSRDRIDVGSLLPGELMAVGKELYAGTGGGPIRVLKVQPEGKKSIDSLSFINGYMTKSTRKLTTTGKEVIR